MKTLSTIKLNQFSKAELDQRQLNALKGGDSCDCGCVCVGGSNSTLTMFNSKPSANKTPYPDPIQV